MEERGIADLACRDRVALRKLMLAERHREVAGRREARPDGRGRERMDPTSFFPKVERRCRQFGARFPIRRHEVGTGANELAVERPDELDIAIAFVVLP